jgi:hypothetical protein
MKYALISTLILKMFDTIRKRNEHYFLTGLMVVNLIETYAKTSTATAENNPVRRNQRRITAAVQQLEQDAAALRRTLLVVSFGTLFMCRLLHVF